LAIFARPIQLRSKSKTGCNLVHAKGISPLIQFGPD
jgi:hypothetical protein